MHVRHSKQEEDENSSISSFTPPRAKTHFVYFIKSQRTFFARFSFTGRSEELRRQLQLCYTSLMQLIFDNPSLEYPVIFLTGCILVTELIIGLAKNLIEKQTQKQPLRGDVTNEILVLSFISESAERAHCFAVCALIYCLLRVSITTSPRFKIG